MDSCSVTTCCSNRATRAARAALPPVEQLGASRVLRLGGDLAGGDLAGGDLAVGELAGAGALSILCATKFCGVSDTTWYRRRRRDVVSVREAAPR